jgi:RNA polymerase sigma factor (sigma-70 family)
MANLTPEFRALLGRIKEGSQEAVQEFLQRYERPLYKVIRKRLAQRLRRQFDSDDLLQEVWKSFFALSPAELQFDTPEQLQAFLIEMACNKVVDAFRHRLETGKCNINMEHSLDGSAGGTVKGIAAPTPTPSAVVMAEEEWERLIRNQPAHYRQILIGLRQGKTHQEIARELGVNERTVRRLVDKLRPRGT